MCLQKDAGIMFIFFAKEKLFFDKIHEHMNFATFCSCCFSAMYQIGRSLLKIPHLTFFVTPYEKVKMESFPIYLKYMKKGSLYL